MTEEIIKECAFYKDGVCASPINKTCEYCKNIDISKCYHKQLKRLGQENKELSFAIEKCLENAGIECDDEEQALRSLPMLGNAHYKVLVEKEALEQENKALKDNNNHLRVIIDDGRAENKRFREENKELQEKVKELDKMTGIFSARLCNKYRSALEEIRILATKNVSIESFVKIQNKINEVLE